MKSICLCIRDLTWLILEKAKTAIFNSVVYKGVDHVYTENVRQKSQLPFLFIFKYPLGYSTSLSTIYLNCCDKTSIPVGLKRHKICVGFNSIVLYLLNDIFIFIGKLW